MAIAVSTLINSNGSSGHGTGSYTTASFTPADGSLLWVGVGHMLNGGSGDPGQPTITDSLGSPLTYTHIQRSRVQGSPFAINWSEFRAPVTTGASMTITVDDDNNENVNIWCVVVLQITGHDTSTPIGGLAFSDTVNIGDGGETQTLSAAPGTNDITICSLFADAENTPNVTMGTGSWTEQINTADGTGSTTRYVAYRTSSTSTSVPVTDSYTGTGSFFKGIMNSTVVQAAAATSLDVPLLRPLPQSNVYRM